MSFIKKFIKKRDDEKRASAAGSAPAGMQAMSTELQLKYAKGVQYNMKVIIKGDRNVGKTTLFLRLQGHKFREEYLPTDEIQVANIQWNYKTTDDVVKVEVWDVVDKGRSKPSADSGLKIKHEGVEDTSPKLDAQFVDVYKGTHAVIMMYDMTKQWTWQYVEREIYNVPARLPIIILANNRDMGQHRTVDMDTTRYFVSSLDRGEGAAPVRFTESSLLNGFGLKFLHAFFNVPFLALQRETLVRQLEANTRETETIQQELDMLTDSDYDRIVEAGRLRRGTPNSNRPPAVSSTSQLLNTAGPSIPRKYVNNQGVKAKAGQSVDDFAPDISGEAMDFFGSDDRKSSNLKKAPSKPTVEEEDDDDDVDGGRNPMVATYQDDFYSSDEDKPSTTTNTTKIKSTTGGGKIASADVVLSSDEDEQEIKPDSESDTDDHESTVDKLTKQFTQTVTTGIPNSTASAHNEAESSDSEDEEEGDSPVILTHVEELSDGDTPKTRMSHNKTVRDSISHSASRTTRTLPSSIDVVLTDSDDDYDRPQVLETELVSSDEQSQVMLPDIATSHQTTKESDEEQLKPTKKKKKARKEKTTTGDGEGERRVKKKTKKSKKSEGDPTRERKKSKSKSKSEKPVLDPLEQFLAGDDASHRQKDVDYECL